MTHISKTDLKNRQVFVMTTGKRNVRQSGNTTEKTATLLNFDAATVKKVREQMLEEKHLSAMSDFF